jgi:hypothetical protein
MLNANYSARSILKSLGTGEVQATAAIFAMQLPPMASDPDAASTIVIVKAMQRGMRQLGCPLKVSGVIDRATENCLRQVGGPQWESKTWLTIGKGIITTQASGSRLVSPPQLEGLGAAGFGGQAAALFITAGIAYLALRK